MKLSTLQTRFEYKADGALDNWRILHPSNLVGDCDDYACTALYILCGESLARFWFELIFGRAKLVYCTIGGVGHVVVKWGDKYIDNIQNEFVTKDEMIQSGYNFSRINFVWPTVAIKMLLGKTKALNDGSAGS